MRSSLILGAVLACAPAFALTINPTYVDNSVQTWTTTQKAVINKAIADWQAQITTNQTINVSLDFTAAGTTSYLGQWSGSASYYYGDSVLPWNDVTHTIHFNASFLTGTNYLWFDPTPTTSNDQPFEAWDALSVARHEIGHMLGFTSLYMLNAGLGNETKIWDSHITTSGGNAYFDASTLNVQMAATTNLGHVAGTDDLMSVALYNSVRKDISSTDLAMLKSAYGYTLVPEPGSIGFAVTSGMYILTRRIRKSA